MTVEGARTGLALQAERRAMGRSPSAAGVRPATQGGAMPPTQTWLPRVLDSTYTHASAPPSPPVPPLCMDPTAALVCPWPLPRCARPAPPRPAPPTAVPAPVFILAAIRSPFQRP